jgi:predicted NBD/HSP70 family sugar kinase
MKGTRRRLRVGIDIGGTSIKLAAIVGEGPPTCLRSDSYDRPTRQALADHLRRSWHELLRQAGAPPTGDVSVGVCVPGPIAAGGVLEAAANLPALVGVRIGSWARQVLKLARPPRVLTDALAAALGEYRANPTAGRTLYLAIGAGVGGLILDDGKPLLITRGTSGHFGHMDVSGGQADAPSTPAGGRGALEAYIGDAALRKAGVDIAAVDGLNHPAAGPALGALARGLRILLALYRPDHIVLMGGLGLKLGPLLGELERRVRDGLTTAAPGLFSLTCGRVGYFAAALGAAEPRRARG